MNEPLAPATTPNANDPRYKRTMVEFALLYAKKDHRIFPLHSPLPTGGCTCGNESCHSIGKHPRTANGVKDASTDRDVISEWWRLYPKTNIGLATGDGIFVIDIDPQHGGSLEALNALVALPPTATVRTGGGGLHLYYSYDASLMIRNSAGTLAPGIDIRGMNGYVVAPPSMHASGTRYSWERHKSYIPAPVSLLNLVVERPFLTVNSAPSTLTPSDTPLLKEEPLTLDLSALTPSDTALLKKAGALAAGSIPEGKRNATLVSLAGSLRNQGASEEVLFLTLQGINTGCCKPPLLDDELRQICKSAATWTPGINGKVTPHNPMLIKHVASLMQEDLPSPPWAIPDLLPEGVSLLAGKPKMGKSWLALSLAISIAQGTHALGTLPTSQGSVLYLGLEDNEQRICSRMTSLLQDEPPPNPLYWAGACAPLTMGGLDDLEAWITSALNPRLVVIDTLARVRAHNGTSSGSIYADDYAAITPLKHLAEQYHLSILLIHHLRKSGATDPMDEISGSTGLTGATDCNMVLQRERGQNNATLHITGRDVEDQELKITFDPLTGLWSLKGSPMAKEISASREAILALLAQKEGPLKPLEIAETLGIEANAVRQRLLQMKKAGQIVSTDRNLYHLPQKTSAEQ